MKLIHTLKNLAIICTLACVLIGCQSRSNNTAPSIPSTKPDVALLPTLKPSMATPTTQDLADDTPDFEHLIPSSPLFSFRTGLGYFVEFPDNQIIALASVADSNNQVTSVPTIGDAMFLQFSNYSNQVAYWTSGDVGRLWISDLFYESPKLLYSDNANKYPMESYPFPMGEMTLRWSPDDLHLILDDLTSTDQDMIYHIRTDTIEDWDYECNQIALSPKSNHVSLWCTAKDASSFAVVEWGGEIWYSDTAPSEVILKMTLDTPTPFAWSYDGSKIAYFDSMETTGALHIINSDGTNQTTIPNLGYWLAEETLIYEFEPPRIKLVEWSLRGDKLLIYGVGTEQQPCKSLMLGDEEEREYIVPCWQVLDTTTGMIVWTLSDFTKEFMESDASYAHFPQAAISPDGDFIAIAYINAPLRSTLIINLSTNELVRNQGGVFMEYLKWSFGLTHEK